MTYEVSPPEMHKRLTLDETILYLFCLGDGWRLPSRAEARDDGILWANWTETDLDQLSDPSLKNFKLNCVPVRTVDNT